MSATQLDSSLAVATANTATAVSPSDLSASSASKIVVSLPDDWQMTGGTKLKNDNTCYESVYERKSLKENTAYNNNFTDKKVSSDEGSNANKQEEKFRIKAIAFLRVKAVLREMNQADNTKSVQPTNHMTIWYDHPAPAQKKLDLGMALLEHPHFRQFKCDYSYPHDELRGVAHITIDIESMREHFAEEFFTFLQHETDLSAEAGRYFRLQGGNKPTPVLEIANIKAIETAVREKNYDEALKITKTIHADSIEENRKLGRVVAFCDRHGSLIHVYLDEARAAYDLYLRLLTVSPEHAYKALEILQESSLYFKEAQLKMANLLLRNIGGDSSYLKEQPSTAHIAKAREHLLLSDTISDSKTMELALQHRRYDEALAIARRIHILSAEKKRWMQMIFDPEFFSLDKTSVAYDLYLRLLPVSPGHAYKALEILQKDSSYFKEAQEKMANILLLNCASSKDKKEIKENAEKALAHLNHCDTASSSIIYLQVLAKDMLASVTIPVSSYNPSAAANPPMTILYDTHASAANASAATITMDTAAAVTNNPAKSDSIAKAK